MLWSGKSTKAQQPHQTFQSIPKIEQKNRLCPLCAICWQKHTDAIEIEQYEHNH